VIQNVPLTSHNSKYVIMAYDSKCSLLMIQNVLLRLTIQIMLVLLPVIQYISLSSRGPKYVPLVS